MYIFEGIREPVHTEGKTDDINAQRKYRGGRQDLAEEDKTTSPLDNRYF